MLFLSLFIFSYGYYYQNDMGGYSLGMGGVPLGLSNRIECGLYNPAAFAGTDKLNIFTGYKLTRGEMSYVAAPSDTLRVNYNFPDYLGTVFPFGKDLFFSISISVPYRSIIKDVEIFTVVDPSEPSGYRAIPVEDIQSERFYFLNTVLGKVINSRFSVGVNMAVFWKRSRWAIPTTGDTVAVLDDIATITMDKYGIEPCLGVQYKASDLLSFGFLIKKGFGEAYKQAYNNVPFYGDTVMPIESGESLPLMIGFGTGINLKEKVYLNLSAEYICWTLAYDRGWLDSDSYRNVVRLHLGGEYRLNEFVSVSAGFYTDPSPVKFVPPYDAGSQDQIFLTGGVGFDFGRVALNLSAASSALIKMDPALKEETHLNLSLNYR
jgi:hypothetical protein